MERKSQLFEAHRKPRETWDNLRWVEKQDLSNERGTDYLLLREDDDKKLETLWIRRTKHALRM